MPYVDGFIIPVPTLRKGEYRAHEAKWWPYFKDLGALSLIVTWGDDVPHGKHTDFYRAVDAQEGETVVLAWMTWPDKATRDAAYGKMMASDSDMGPMEMPFDGKRLIHGGFTPILIEGTLE